jgi:hypothetical protein
VLTRSREALKAVATTGVTANHFLSLQPRPHSTFPNPSPRWLGPDRKPPNPTATHDRARHRRDGRRGHRTRSRGPRPRGSGPRRRSVVSRRVESSTAQRSAGTAHHARDRGASATGTCARWPGGGALPAAAYGARGPDGRKGPPVPGVPVRPAGERQGPVPVGPRPELSMLRALRFLHLAIELRRVFIPPKLNYE